MKNFSIFFLLFFLFCSCSNESIDDLAYNILDDDSVPLVTFFNPTTGTFSATIEFTSIYDQLSSEAQATITQYKVYRNEIEVNPMPLSATEISVTGMPGSVYCLAIAFDSTQGESRRSSTYCLTIP